VKAFWGSKNVLMTCNIIVWGINGIGTLLLFFALYGPGGHLTSSSSSGQNQLESYQDPSREKLDAVLNGSDPDAEAKMKLLCLKTTKFDPACAKLNNSGGKWNLK